MEVMLSNGIGFLIEFLKLFLAVVCILKIQVKKNINILFGVSLVGVTLISHWINLSIYGFVDGLILFAIFLIVLYKKRNIGYVITAYIVICIADMLFSVVAIRMFHITMEQLEQNYIFVELLDSISMIFLLFIIIFLNRIKKKQSMVEIKNYLPIVILSGILVAVYLTHTQLVGLEKNSENYYNGLVVSAIAIAIVYFVIGYVLLKNQMKNYYLKLENDVNQRLLKSQNDYYSMMIKKETETKMFRHDIKGHLMCIQMLYEQKKYEELGDYLAQMDAGLKELSPQISTGNAYIDVILVDLMEQFPKVGIKWTGKIPELSVSSMDVCTLFYNLMKNAFEAADKVAEKKINAITKIQGRNLFIEISNGYGQLKRNGDEEFMTTKQENGHGYGLKNIERCVRKYKGSYTISTENRVFCIEIVLPDVIKEILD